MSDAAHTWRSCSECNCPLLKGPESHEAPIEWLCPSCGGVQIEDSSSWSARQSARRQQIWSDLLRRAKDTKVAKGGATDAASSAPHPSRIPETTGPPISDDAYAEYELGRDHYDRWQQDGDSHNLAEALLHLRNAAGRGEELAYSDLGDLAFTQANTVEAMQWLRKAEAVGHTVAPLLDSVRQTTLELASQGRPDAQFEIAEWYLNGHGVAKDPKAAAAWLTKAAQQEFPAAMFTLSRLLDSGDGVNANTEMALTFGVAPVQWTVTELGRHRGARS